MSIPKPWERYPYYSRVYSPQYQPYQYQSTQNPAFDVVGSFVHSFGSFAALLDSTLQAVNQSFHAFSAVGQQLNFLTTPLRNFSLFSILQRLTQKKKLMCILLFLALFPFLLNRNRINPSDIKFVQALFDYDASGPNELSFRQNDVITIIERPPLETPAWWKGRLNGSEGYFPSTYVRAQINKI